MPKRSRKPRDINQLAKSIVDDATSDEPKDDEEGNEKKNPAAVALGRLGGRKGGKARAKALSGQRRAEIARAAAKARWSKK
jgi:hypothetical protein